MDYVDDREGSKQSYTVVPNVEHENDFDPEDFEAGLTRDDLVLQSMGATVPMRYGSIYGDNAAQFDISNPLNSRQKFQSIYQGVSTRDISQVKHLSYYFLVMLNFLLSVFFLFFFLSHAQTRTHAHTNACAHTHIRTHTHTHTHTHKYSQILTYSYTYIHVSCVLVYYWYIFLV